MSPPEDFHETRHAASRPAKLARRTLKYSLLATGFLMTLATVVVAALGLAYLSAGVNAGTVEKYLGEQLKRPVRIESIETRWAGLNAEVDARGIRILRQDGRRVALQLERLEISFDPLTLLRPDPGLGRIVVHGLSLRVLRTRDGRIQIGDLVTRPDRPPNPVLEWFLAQPSSEIKEASLTWSDELDSKRSTTLSGIDIVIDNTSGETRFSGWAEPPASLGESVSVSGEILGQPLRSGLWDGRVEFDVRALRLEELPLVVRQSLPWQTGGLLSARIDTEWLEGHIIEASGDLNLSAFEIPFERGGKVVPVSNFISSILWQQNLKDWRLEFANPEVNVNGSVLGTRRFLVQRTNQTRTYHVETLELEQIIAVRDQLRFELPWNDVGRHVKPNGRFDGVSVVTRGPFLSPDHWRVQAGFEGIGWNAFAGIPGITGARGSMEVEPSAGRIELDASGVKLDLPGVLSESVYFNEVKGGIRWARDPLHWNIEVDGLDLSNSDLQSLRGSARLRVPVDGSGAPRIDSGFTVEELEVDKLIRYLPRSRWPPKVVQWLEHGLLQGSFRNARIDLSGDLSRFPFRSGGGSFFVTTDILDARLHYADSWPDADKIYGRFNLNNAAMHAEIASAEIGGSRVISAIVESADLLKRGATIDVRARLASPADDVVRFLTRGPLTRSKDPLSIQAEGSGGLELDVHLPLADLKNGVRVSGRYEVRNVALTVVDRFAFVNLKGEVEFTESTVEGSGISGVLLGGPVTLDIDTIKAGRPPVWRVRARGELAAAELAPLLESGVVTAHVAGATGWSGALVVDDGDATLEIESGLKGVEISLPEPLAKSPGERRHTTIEARIDRSAQQYRFRSGPLSGLLAYGREDAGPLIRSGVVALGKADPGEPPAEGIGVRIQQPFLNLDKWLALIESDVNADSSARGAFQSALRSVELEFEDVRFLSRNLGATNARAISDDGLNWRAWMFGDHVRGQVEAVMRRGAPSDYRMSFDRLYLPKPRGGKRTAAPDRSRMYPNLEIRAEHFIFGEWDLGRLDMKATSHAGRWGLDKLTLDQPGLHIDASGHWEYDEAASTTRISATMHSEDVLIALKRLSLPPHIAEARANLDITLEWPGDPQGFELRRLGGTFAAIAEGGRFLNVDPGSGRLLGLFNVDAIQRRLSLDFSDIFDQGLAFDRIEAEGTIAEGSLHSEGMFIVGPSALIDISGRTGLADEDYDLRVVVAPHVGSQISLLSALANPVAGAMMFIAQKMFEKQLARMIQYQYDITGSWDEPQFTTVRWEPELVEETAR